jgi:putative ABC transport system permease protein
VSVRAYAALALESMRRHRLRTALTMLNIAWGVALTLVMGSLRGSLGSTFVHEIERIGMREVYVWPERRAGLVEGFRATRPVRFDDRSLAVLRRHCPSLQHLSPQVVVGPTEVEYATNLRSFPVIGVDPEFHALRGLAAGGGRELTETDRGEARAVCFLGDVVRQRLFGAADPIGRRVRIGNHPFTVVGVAAPKGYSMFRSGGWQDDDVVWIPTTTAQRLFAGADDYGLLVLQATTREASYSLMQEVRRALGALHGFAPDDEDAITFFNTVDNVAKVLKIQEGSGRFGRLVVVATLALGAVGLMNILIAAVHERTREIGVRRALGATRRGIMAQFLAESLAMTMVAGSVGVALALFVNGAMRLLPLPEFFQAPPMPFAGIAAVYGSMVAIGLAAGVVPARRAAALDPAVALRHE